MTKFGVTETPSRNLQDAALTCQLPDSHTRLKCCMKITWCLLFLDLVYSGVPLIFPPQWKQLIQHHQELLFDLELACAHAQLIAFAALASVSWMCAVFIITSKTPSKLLQWRVSEKPHISSCYVRWSWLWRAGRGMVAFCAFFEKRILWFWGCKRNLRTSRDIIAVAETRAICQWSKTPWTDSWKDTTFGWGQISEVMHE